MLVAYPDNQVTGKRGPNKQLTPLRGPLRVHSIVGNTYKLINLINNKVNTVNINKLVPFYFDPEVHVGEESIIAHNLLSFYYERFVKDS